MADEAAGAVAEQTAGAEATTETTETIDGAGDDAAIEAAERAAFDKARGKDTPKPGEGADDAAQPKADPVSEDDTAGDDPDDAGEGPDEEPGEGTIDRDALARAVSVLRRDNVPDDLIESMLSTDRAKLLAWAEKAGKRQADIDKLLKPGGKNAEAAETPTEAASKTTDAEPTGSPADDAEAIAAMLEPFATELGSEQAAETFTKLASHIRTQTLAEVQPVLDELKQALGFLAGQHERREVSAARSSLRERFPQVDNDSDWAKVMERATVLSNSGGYDSYEAVLADAARIEFGEFNLRAEQQRHYERQKTRSGTQPTAPSRKPAKPPATPEEQEMAVFRAIKAGKDPRTALAG